MSFRRDSPYVTWILLIGIAVVFLLESLSGGSQNVDTLIYFGAKINSLVQGGDWWRLITPIFIHIGVIHILTNGFTLYFVGRILEPLIGHTRFFLIFMLSGITGNLASFAFGANNTIAAGASTSLFGLFAAFLALAMIYRENHFLGELGKTFLALILINLALDFSMTGIDIWGHIGGAVGGFLLGIAFGLPGIKRPNIFIRIIAFVACLAVSYFMYTKGMVVYG
ncbi:rhomboid family intramembrane serine protease [Companilactobacillus ginsenosidimutans]|uniref:Transporter n=1 Tax=Companilactobacillus ginsenosidimutans TaxID=1007676 RepID=A0A0H4QED3_9LACO|nr:rhomboid family intramembrane serine protease [Companilactobacillus ginsenosidimutans]AKP66739.1 transporter [Companilactobacillus ginsenosidimutans]